MTEDFDCELVEVAAIYSRPELVCFVSALRAEGIHVDVCGEHYINATLQVFACGGYRVRVPAFQLPDTVMLTEALREQTDSLGHSASQRRLLFRAIALYALLAFFFSTGNVMAFLSFFLSLLMPTPPVIAGDYVNRRGKVVQMR